MRFVGTILLAAALSYHFLSSYAKEEKAFRETRGFLLLLRHIRAEIAGLSTPLPDIIAKFDNEALQKCGFLAAANEKELADALVASRAESALPDKLYSELLTYFSSFGKSFRTEELSRCDSVTASLEEAVREMEAALPKKRRLSRAYALTGSLFLLLIFL